MSEYVLQGLVALGLVAVVSLTAPAQAGEPDFEKLFAGRDGCFELYDLKTSKRLVRSNARRCAEDFCYASDTNPDWLSVAQLRELIKPYREGVSLSEFGLRRAA